MQKAKGAVQNDEDDVQLWEDYQSLSFMFQQQLFLFPGFKINVCRHKMTSVALVDPFR